MIIAARNLPKYLNKVAFPCDILAERSDAVAVTVSRKELLRLIQAEAVIGIGSWKRLRWIRLNRPMDRLVDIRVSEPRYVRRTPIVGDLMRMYLVRKSSTSVDRMNQALRDSYFK